MKFSRILGAISMVAFLAACSSKPAQQVFRPDGKKVFRSAMMKNGRQGRHRPSVSGQKIGAPYSINGKWYYPEHDPEYSEEGLASWYGPGFHGNQTANGETYDQYDLTAAHTTLPLPSLVNVTNLENGKQLVVRVNDRGPFHDGRIIDLSKASAERLGITGLAKVKVDYLHSETIRYLASNGSYIPESIEQSEARPLALASSDRVEPVRREVIVQPLPDGEFENNDVRDVEVSIADNRGPVVSSMPLLSVSSRSLEPLQQEKTVDVSVNSPVPSEYESRITLASNMSSQMDAEPALLMPPSLPPAQKAVSEVEVVKPAVMQPVLEVTSVPDAYTSHLAFHTKVKPIQKQVTAEKQVQVASFSSRQNAEAMMIKLANLGVAELREVLVGGREWYRVMMQPLRTQSATDLLRQLHHLGLRDAYILN